MPAILRAAPGTKLGIKEIAMCIGIKCPMQMRKPTAVAACIGNHTPGGLLIKAVRKAAGLVIGLLFYPFLPKNSLRNLPASGAFRALCLPRNTRGEKVRLTEKDLILRELCSILVS